MVAEVWDLNVDKLFKTTKLNLKGRAKEWFKKLNPTPIDWPKLHTWIVHKYGNIDADDIRLKLDATKQEPKERVQKYYEKLDKLFQNKGCKTILQISSKTKAINKKTLCCHDLH
jgi:hypothetical protein